MGLGVVKLFRLKIFVCINYWQIFNANSIFSSEDDGSSFSNMEFSNRGPSSQSLLVMLSLVDEI